MTVSLLQFLVAAAVIIAAGTRLTRAADTLAERSGLGRLLIGSVLLAALTSLPELSVDISAARQGLPDLAVGDLAGSCLFNLLILALADMFSRSRGRLLGRAGAAHALSGTMGIVLAASAALAILARGTWTLGPLGLGSVAVALVWLLGVRITYLDQHLATAAAHGGAAPVRPIFSRALRRPLLECGLAAAVIVLAAPHLAGAAGALADHYGVSETFVGTTLVAFTTSLPELTTTITALRLGAPALAVGNIFGSNAFNIVILLPVDAAAAGPLLGTISPAHALSFLWVVVATAAAVIGQLYHAEKRIAFIEPDALLVALLALAGLATSYFA